jgi:LysM repeat protein
MKIPQFFRPKKLQAATARRASAASAGMDFDDIPEPNMKLSRALLIVLLLHVVAVSGIIAFNAIKTRESSYVPPPAPSNENKPAETVRRALPVQSAVPTPPAAQKQTTPRVEAKLSASPAKEKHAKGPASSGKSYTVKKGDNPVAIAKKLKVPYDDLMALNHIDNPRKLQIGQKLLIPEVTKSKTTTPKATTQKKKK